MMWRAGLRQRPGVRIASPARPLFPSGPAPRLGRMSNVDDRLEPLKRRIAAQHLGNAALGVRLRGGNTAQLRQDAERVRADAGVLDRGRPTPEAAEYVYRREQRRRLRRLFG
jgi:hypothetical protein